MKWSNETSVLYLSEAFICNDEVCAEQRLGIMSDPEDAVAGRIL